MWIERRLQDPHLGGALRAQLEALRRKALAGQLTLREFQEVRRQGHAGAPPLRAALTSVRAVRRRLAAVPGLSAQILGTLDTLIGELEAALATTRRIARLAGYRGPAPGARRCPRGGELAKALGVIQRENPSPLPPEQSRAGCRPRGALQVARRSTRRTAPPSRRH